LTDVAKNKKSNAQFEVIFLIQVESVSNSIYNKNYVHATLSTLLQESVARFNLLKITKQTRTKLINKTAHMFTTDYVKYFRQKRTKIIKKEISWLSNWSLFGVTVNIQKDTNYII
jgi:hypothetical protein